MKSYTDIEQSKDLAKILPLESADYFWAVDVNIVITAPYITNVNGEKCVPAVDNAIPCWSLAALLSVLPDYTLQTNTDGTVFVVCDSKKPMISGAYDNPIDACYEMLLKLNELKRL